MVSIVTDCEVTMFAEYDKDHCKIHVYFDEDDHICMIDDVLICIYGDCPIKDANSEGDAFGVVLFGVNDYVYAPIETYDNVEFYVDYNDVDTINAKRDVVITGWKL